ncbi:hypothetical protein NDU88_008602 [Pleurodeles waltl]|uniref:Uncharacterized protein n=1 Tax=Pleurodeles waltl TaxID=8319 RepID=A0AAV7QQC9_PLEWA|nr:hypothetical protein NDU88_008602 [Pleurodeles waltl]
MESPHRDAWEGQPKSAGASSPPDIHIMFLNLKQILTATDNKIDLLADHFDLLKEKIDKHNDRLDQLEHCMSEAEDVHLEDREKILRMVKVLEVIWNKNEDLEACSWRNNLLIL